MGIERTLFLQMCQKCSVLPSGICGIKENVPDDLKVEHNGIIYNPQAYKLSFDNKGGVLHPAILHDLKVNAIIECILERVAIYEQGRSNQTF